MSEVAIKVENLGKKYIIGHQKAGDLRSSFSNKLKDLFGRTNGIAEEFWALRDINFEVKQGEAVGIIGRNGAGKSTLLKILSRITDPTTGRFEINGRVSSLLEVGTGFHQELTGRENIYLNGTILGMKRSEIKAKFDQIVDFSGVEKFLDTPVKHYSSGMKVRLAFSVAAHLEPEILIVDEVLAVGDAEFQRKCLGKMDEVSKGQGRTILFVSHNLAAVSQLCQKGILLSQGELIEMSQVTTVISSYISQGKQTTHDNTLINLGLRKGDGQFRVKTIRMVNDQAEPIVIARTGSELNFEFRFNRTIRKEEGSFRIDFAIDTEQDMRVGWFSSDAVSSSIDNQFDVIILKLPKFNLGSGRYYLTFYATLNGNIVDFIHQGFSFEVEEGDFFNTGKVIPKTQTFIYSDHQIYSG
jgi:lipopolysaccharide transport system ATP-binding protein